MDPVLLQIYQYKLSAIAEEMGKILGRTAFSPNIKERKDYSCALFDANCQLIAQAAHIPVHLGSTHRSVEAVLKKIKLQEGDIAIVNDPFHGGTHLPDITLVAPLYWENKYQPKFYIANRAHHSDVGGETPGSMPISRSIHEEGIRITPQLLINNNQPNQQFWDKFLASVRSPENQKGDLSAQISAIKQGEIRLKELLNQKKLVEIENYCNHLLNYSENIIRHYIRNIPDGTYKFEDYLEDDGFNSKNIKLKLALEISNDHCTLDFSGTDNQVPGCMNAVSSITESAILYCFRCLVGEHVPTNHGIIRPLKIIIPEGCVLNAKYPAAVSGGNVETSQRVVDLIFGALAKAIGDKIPAASAGTMNNFAFGIKSQNKMLTYYETIGGGLGAGKFNAGADAYQSHMTNTQNTPIEVMEIEYPVTLLNYSIIKKSGGEGKMNGGNGILKKIQMNSLGEATLITENRYRKPWGLFGGQPGSVGKNTIFRKNKVGKNYKTENLPAKCHFHFKAGDIIQIETPGGGGYGAMRHEA